MIISMAYPGRYMRLFYIALVGLLIFDFAFYPLPHTRNLAAALRVKLKKNPKDESLPDLLQRHLSKKQREKLHHWSNS